MDKYKSEIEAILGAFWDARAIAVAENPTSIFELGAPLTSLDACEALVDVDKLVGKKIPVQGIIKNGGYEDRDDFINELTTNILSHLGSEQNE